MNTLKEEIADILDSPSGDHRQMLVELFGKVLVEIGVYLESEHGKAPRFGVQRIVEKYGLGTYNSDYEK